MPSVRVGLSSYHLKLIALICMTIDHFGAFAGNIPFFAQHYTLLRIIGRISAPLFLFAVVQGAIHTRSKVKYLLRLYAAGTIVSIFDFLVYTFWGKAAGIPGWGNIFITFAFVVLYIILAELLLSGLKTKNRKIILLALLGFAATLAPYGIAKLFALLLNGRLPQMAYTVSRGILMRLLPNVFSVSYGLPFLALGISMYFAKTKSRQCWLYLFFCLLCVLYVYFLRQHLPSLLRTLVGSTYNKTQCYMLLALPFMLLYNGKKGRGAKWLFYGYYPLHRYLIAFAGLLCR